MPVSASNMAQNTASVSLQIGEDTLNVTYFPSKVTSKMIAQLDDAMEGIQQGLSSLIKSWDVLNDDGSMYPTDPESLAALGLPILLKVSQAIARDIRPN